MKTKKIVKNLSLSKETISNLNMVKGGTPPPQEEATGGTRCCSNAAGITLCFACR